MSERQETYQTDCAPESTLRSAQGRFVVTLPYPPSVNHLYRQVNGRTLLSAGGRRYHNDAGQIAVGAVNAQGMPAFPHVVTVLATPPDKRRRDLDNLTKIVSDVVYAAFKTKHEKADDSGVDVWHLEWRRDGRQACVEVIVETAA